MQDEYERLDIENVITKVKKLLALTKSPNEHEAALAAARVSELLLKYKLDMSHIEGTEDQDDGIIEERIDVTNGMNSRSHKWMTILAINVAKICFCKTITITGTKTIAFIGKKTDVSIAKELYFYINSQIIRITNDEWDLTDKACIKSEGYSYSK